MQVFHVEKNMVEQSSTVPNSQEDQMQVKKMQNMVEVEQSSIVLPNSQSIRTT